MTISQREASPLEQVSIGLNRNLIFYLLFSAFSESSGEAA
jgi:hypothetical protein